MFNKTWTQKVNDIFGQFETVQKQCIAAAEGLAIEYEAIQDTRAELALQEARLRSQAERATTLAAKIRGFLSGDSSGGAKCE